MKKLVFHIGLRVNIFVQLFLLILTTVELTDKMDIGYIPLLSYLIFFARIVLFGVMCYFLYRDRKEKRKFFRLIIIESIVYSVLFLVNWIINLSVAFS